MTHDEQCEALLVSSYERGKARGNNDRLSGFTNDAPLSGEWSGESITELLGDLITKAEWLQNTEELCQEICENYENGYYDGNTQ